VQNGRWRLKVSAGQPFLPGFEVVSISILRERTVREDLGGRQAISRGLYSGVAFSEGARGEDSSFSPISWLFDCRGGCPAPLVGQDRRVSGWPDADIATTGGTERVGRGGGRGPGESADRLAFAETPTAGWAEVYGIGCGPRRSRGGARLKPVVLCSGRRWVKDSRLRDGR
jgi:hypothetical protein